MPKDTFLNLPEEKRLLIEDVALDEFIEYGFDNASINRIVEQCQIAKGSFYQYFSDKKDLYKHLIYRVGMEKQEYLAEELGKADQKDFFTLVSDLIRTGLEFIKIQPKYALFGNQLLKFKDHPVHKEILQDSQNLGKQFFEPLLQLAIQKGEVRPDIDLGFISYMLVSINMATFDYYFDVVKNGKFEFSEIESDVMNTVSLSMAFIKNGISCQ